MYNAWTAIRLNTIWHVHWTNWKSHMHSLGGKFCVAVRSKFSLMYTCQLVSRGCLFILAKRHSLVNQCRNEQGITIFVFFLFLVQIEKCGSPFHKPLNSFWNVSCLLQRIHFKYLVWITMWVVVCFCVRDRESEIIVCCVFCIQFIIIMTWKTSDTKII